MLLNPSNFITTSPLEDFSIRVANDMSAYAGLKVFPLRVVKNKTGKFYQYSKHNLKIMDLTAPSGSEAKRGIYDVFTSTYTCTEKAHKILVLGKDARDFDRPVADLDQEAALQNMDRLMIELEDAVYTKVSTTANYPAALVNTLTDNVDRWDNAGGEPVDDVRELRQEIAEQCGKYPNKMALAKKGLEILRINAQVVDRVKYTGQAVTDQIIATLLDLQEINVSAAIKNTATDGAADSLSTVWGDEALLYVDAPPALKAMTYGVTMMVNRLYVKTIDRPELGRELGAHDLESGWEYTLEFGARVSSSDGDAIAGGLIDNIF